jgi:hypothetical protein
MKKPYGYKIDGTSMTLSDSVECMALVIAEEYCKDEKRIEEIQQRCKILDSLSMALLAVKKIVLIFRIGLIAASHFA